jgi:hypothetical protein
MNSSCNSYITALQQFPLRILKIRKNPNKKQYYLVFKGPRDLDKDALEADISQDVEEKLRGTVDWPEEA